MAGELTYQRLLNYLKILEADESPMLDLKVQVKIDETDGIRHIACIMVTAEPAPHQPYLLTCADPQSLDDDEDTEDCDDEEPTYESELNRTPWTAYKSPNRW